MSESPSKLQELYHATPRLKSPESVDQQVMLAARAAASHPPAAAKIKRRAPGMGMSLPALAAMCVIGVGVGLLYQSDKESSGVTVIEIVQNTPAARSMATDITQADSETDLFVEQAPVPADASILAMEADTTDSDAAGMPVESFSAQEPLQQRIIVAEPVVVPDDDQSDSTAAVTAIAESVTLESKRLSAVASIESAADTLVRSDSSSKARTNRERKEQNLVPGNLWLQKQNSNGFTIRLTTTNSIETLKEFAASVEQLPTEMIRLNNRQWVLLYGSFDTLGEVQQVYDSLQSGVAASEQSDVAIVAVSELQNLIE